MFCSFHVLFFCLFYAPLFPHNPPSSPSSVYLGKHLCQATSSRAVAKNPCAGAKKTSPFQAVCTCRRTRGVISGCRIKYECTIVNQKLLNELFWFCLLPGRCTCAPSQLQMTYIFVFLFNIQHMRHTYRKIKIKRGKAGRENRFFFFFKSLQN